MAKEWILNSAMNRYQLNFKRNVGAVSEAIRTCAPKRLSDWEEFYFSNIRTEEHIVSLGRKLYIKITEVISKEVSEITEEDCIQYIRNLVINRTYDGYTTEISTIYGQLEKLLDEKIEAAPDEWDRKFNVDFYIKVSDHYIGLQIKPVSDVSQIPEIHKERKIQEQSHVKFTSLYGGRVFYVYSKKHNKKKVIHNIDVVDEIKNEIRRLS
jgi:hypothetical protein